MHQHPVSTNLRCLDAAYKLVVIEGDSEANDAQDDAGDE